MEFPKTRKKLKIGPKCKECEKPMPSASKDKVFCNTTCRRNWRIANEPPNVICETCGIPFHKEPCTIGKRVFCSTKCSGNRNWTDGVKTENDLYTARGYKRVHPRFLKIFSSEHQRVACRVLKIDKIPKGFSIHHRDVDKTNNSPKNLAVLSNSDHRWLHSQAGSVGLKLFAHGAIDVKVLSKYSTDPEKFERLINLSIVNQNANEFK